MPTKTRVVTGLVILLMTVWFAVSVFFRDVGSDPEGEFFGVELSTRILK